jgi:hypothetical protein
LGQVGLDVHADGGDARHPRAVVRAAQDAVEREVHRGCGGRQVARATVPLGVQGSQRPGELRLEVVAGVDGGALERRDRLLVAAPVQRQRRPRELGEQERGALQPPLGRREQPSTSSQAPVSSRISASVSASRSSPGGALVTSMPSRRTSTASSRASAWCRPSAEVDVRRAELLARSELRAMAHRPPQGGPRPSSTSPGVIARPRRR